MHLTICDLCPQRNFIPAIYRLNFSRLPTTIGSADRPIELCQKHYDEAYRLIMNMDESEHA
jgi:hypothetical protein